MRRLILAIALSVLPAAAAGPNFSGKWILEVPGARGNQTAILVLNHVGNDVDGTLTIAGRTSSGSPNNVDILGGKVNGDSVTFYVWEGRDQMVKMQYRGTLSGDDIKFTITGEPVNFDFTGQRTPARGPQQAAAKRTK
jgi:hypothetical protein